jgi:cell division protein FtsZ
VVVGYVIDPEMTDQIRVTVVATGIGRPTAVRGMPAGMPPPRVEVVQSRARRRPLDNYADYDQPSFRRRPRAVGEDVRADAAGDDSYLDIPAFLRRQAD